MCKRQNGRYTSIFITFFFLGELCLALYYCTIDVHMLHLLHYILMDDLLCVHFDKYQFFFLDFNLCMPLFICIELISIGIFVERRKGYIGCIEKPC